MVSLKKDNSSDTPPSSRYLNEEDSQLPYSSAVSVNNAER